MYVFGHGLTYTTFSYSNLNVSGGETITATFTVTNTGKVAGADVPQVYLTDAAGEKRMRLRMRLLGFERDLLLRDGTRYTIVDGTSLASGTAMAIIPASHTRP